MRSAAFIFSAVTAVMLGMHVARAQTSVAPAQMTGPNQVVVAGTVPDEATRIAVITRMRELYGADRVVDQLALGAVVAPPQWQQYVQKL